VWTGFVCLHDDASPLEAKIWVLASSCNCHGLGFCLILFSFLLVGILSFDFPVAFLLHPQDIPTYPTDEPNTKYHEKNKPYCLDVKSQTHVADKKYFSHFPAVSCILNNSRHKQD